MFYERKKLRDLGMGVRELASRIQKYFRTFFFVVVNCLFIERLFLTPESHGFIVQEHRKVTNFHGTQPKKFFIFQITLHSEKYQPSSAPQNLSWNHNFCRNLHMPSFFVQPQQTYRKLQTPWSLWTLQQYEIADVWPEGHASEVLPEQWTW